MTAAALPARPSMASASQSALRTAAGLWFVAASRGNGLRRARSVATAAPASVVKSCRTDGLSSGNAAASQTRPTGGAQSNFDDSILSDLE
jgi:hypothetical protein